MSNTSRRFVGLRQEVRHAAVDQARLLVAGNHVDRQAQHRLRLGDEHLAVHRFAQGRRRHRPHARVASTSRTARQTAPRWPSRAASRLRRAVALSSSPAPRRTVSFRYSARTRWPCSARQISSRKAVRSEVDRGDLQRSIQARASMMRRAALARTRDHVMSGRRVASIRHARRVPGVRRNRAPVRRHWLRPSRAATARCPRHGSARGHCRPARAAPLPARLASMRLAFQSTSGAKRTLISVCGNSDTPCSNCGRLGRCGRPPAAPATS